MKPSIKPSILLGSLLAVPIAIVLMVQYAATPQDPQKGIGYVTISLYVAFVWASATLFIEGLRRFFRKGPQRGGSASFLLPGLVLLVFALTFFWKVQSTELLMHRLAKEESSEVLRQQAERAVSGKAIPVLLVIAGNPNTPADVLSALTNAELDEVTQKVAGNPSAPEALLHKLSQHPRFLVKKAVARNPSASKALLKEMAKSDHVGTRKAAHERLSSAPKREQ